MVFRQIVILFVLALVLGLGVNLFSPNSIDYIGKFRDLSGGTGPIIPPSAQPGDPPFIDINVAQMQHSVAKALWVDARNNEEFECGTIPGSLNIPFEKLPDGDLHTYFDSCLAHVSKDYAIVVFCSGEECDLSLQLARNMKEVGYTNLSIFFGGAREWEKFGLEMQRKKKCGA